MNHAVEQGFSPEPAARQHQGRENSWYQARRHGPERDAKTEANRGRLALFAGIDGVRFKRLVEPGDELELTCDLERVRGPIGKGRAEARVDGELAARATLIFAVER